MKHFILRFLLLLVPYIALAITAWLHSDSGKGGGNDGMPDGIIPFLVSMLLLFIAGGYILIEMVNFFIKNNYRSAFQNLLLIAIFTGAYVLLLYQLNR